MTELQQLQEERRKVQLMKTLHQTLSHDIMSPIENIKCFANSMKRKAFLKDREGIDKYHRLIVNQSQIVYNRMKDLLDQGLIDNGKFVAHNVEFTPNQAVTQITDILRHLLVNNDVNVIDSLDPMLDGICTGDRDRLQQVLLNLTTNARKFVPKQAGRIKIKTKLITMGRQDFLRVSVEDNGPGIPVED